MKTIYELLPLDYELDALEPVISKETMEFHYFKHHKGYVDKLNSAMLGLEKATSLEELVKLQKAIGFNGGGHINHSLFWENLAPVSSGKNKPCGDFLKQLEKDFGSFENFKESFTKKALAVQGSGWVWLGYNKEVKTLEILSTQNHEMIDFPVLLVVDVWEHAYYLQYKNERNTFLNEIWKIVNFEKVDERYKQAIK